MPFPRRPSGAGFLSGRPRAFSSLSRISIAPSVASGSGTGSLKYVGEGTLDDSDSEGEVSGDAEGGSERAGPESTGDELSSTSRRMISPTSPLFGRSASAASQPSPSPLSRVTVSVAGQRTWAEDVDDDDNGDGDGEEGG